MRPLRYSINVTLDGCCDHRVMIPDEDLHRHEERRPDVVVLDVEMPVIGAQAVMRRMSRLDPTSETRRA